MEKKQIPLFKVFMADTVGEEVKKVLYSGFIGQGPKVEEFEAVLKNFFHNDRVLTLNSATSAEHLALLLLSKPQKEFPSEYGSVISAWPGIQQGDEILASPLSCLASNTPIVLSGFKIKWVDIDPLSLNMDLDDLARKITPKTKAVMLPFWGGMPVDMNSLRQIQNDALGMVGFKPAIIIDGAHSLGSYYEGKHISNHGHITTYSFQAIKHITSVDGGALVVPHQELYRRGKLLRWYGLSREGSRQDFRCYDDCEEAGTKWHMSDVNATIGIENFKHAYKVIHQHVSNAEAYDKFFNSSDIVPQKRTPNANSAYWLYTVFLDKRDDFMKYMASNGIATSRVHERMDKKTCFREFQSQLPGLESIMDKYVCIPVHHGVTNEDREFICETIKKGW